MVHLSTLRYDIFTGMPPGLVTLVELASVYYTGLPRFVLKSTNNKRGLDRDYALTRTPPLFFTDAPGLVLYHGHNAKRLLPTRLSAGYSLSLGALAWRHDA